MNNLEDLDVFARVAAAGSMSAAGRELGLAPAAGTVSEGYIDVDTSAAPGAGITGETMQFHGAADRYTLTAGAGATAVATVYSTATSASAYSITISRTSTRPSTRRGRPSAASS